MMFAGKVVLVTGASSGIGAATALHFATHGAELSLTGRSSDHLQKIADECETLSKLKPLVTACDLTNETDAKNVLESTIKRYNRLDVLINNAGIIEVGSIEDTSLAQFNRIFKTNVQAAYYLTMLAVPHIIKSKGNIVNTSSMCGLCSFPGFLAYNMSKSAIDQFTKCLALELGDKEVRVNSVNPGVIKTSFQKRAGLNDESYREFMEKMKENQALHRNGEPEEVADAIAFLASAHASFITGVNLSVDGGCHAMCPR